MDPREDEVGIQFLMNMIADGNIEEEEAVLMLIIM
jgi:hypothetical protein